MKKGNSLDYLKRGRVWMVFFFFYLIIGGAILNEVSLVYWYVYFVFVVFAILFFYKTYSYRKKARKIDNNATYFIKGYFKMTGVGFLIALVFLFIIYFLVYFISPILSGITGLDIFFWIMAFAAIFLGIFFYLMHKLKYRIPFWIQAKKK